VTRRIKPTFGPTNSPARSPSRLVLEAMSSITPKFGNPGHADLSVGTDTLRQSEPYDDDEEEEDDDEKESEEEDNSDGYSE
jgi:hypothetical protein